MTIHQRRSSVKSVNNFQQLFLLNLNCLIYFPFFELDRCDRIHLPLSKSETLPPHRVYDSAHNRSLPLLYASPTKGLRIMVILLVIKDHSQPIIDEFNLRPLSFHRQRINRPTAISSSIFKNWSYQDCYYHVNIGLLLTFLLVQFSYIATL